MQADECHHAGMKVKATQYTIRNVPPFVDRALRRRAVAAKVSLNTLLLRALEAEAGVTQVRDQHDLDSFFGRCGVFWRPDGARRAPHGRCTLRAPGATLYGAADAPPPGTGVRARDRL